MECWSMESWAQAAVQQMKFRHDREAVRKELRDHMLDRRVDFLDQGMALDAAEDAVLEAMGDPVETGVLLNKVHSPWLGWLWLLSKWLSVLLLLTVFVVVLSNNNPAVHWKRYAGIVFGKQEPCSCVEQFDDFPQFDPLPVETGLQLQISGYTLTLDHGFYYINPIEDGGEQYLTLAFQIRGDQIWDVAPAALQRELEAVDDLGNTYVLKNTSLYQVDMVDVGLPVWMVHIRLFIPYDGPLQQRVWFRFHVPDTAFSFTVYTDGEVSKWG